jgi:hypothetical protein
MNSVAQMMSVAIHEKTIRLESGFKSTSLSGVETLGQRSTHCPRSTVLTHPRTMTG